MKKYVLYSLYSALVIPGLGQVFNKRIIKGVTLMALILMLFIAIMVSLLLAIIIQMPYVLAEGVENIYIVMIKSLTRADLSTFWSLLIISVTLWIYSIVDAFIDGLKLEKGLRENPDEILSD